MKQNEELSTTSNQPWATKDEYDLESSICYMLKQINEYHKLSA